MWAQPSFNGPASSKPRIKITWWHSMAGPLGATLDKIVQQFNHSQNKYQVVPIYKGDYPQTLTSLVAAFRAKQQPVLAQVFEVGTATMLYPKGIIVPVYKVLQNAHINLYARDFLPAIASYYSDNQSRLMAFPFNSSTPVLFYNKKAFVKAGLNPNQPPRTWPQLKQDSLKLLRAGNVCGFTTTWPSWIQLEAFSAWQNIPFASQDNGFKSLNAKLLFANPTVIQHIATLAKWQKKHIFEYGGRLSDADSLFTSGQCAMLMESSGDRSSLMTDTSFPVGVGPIPYSPKVKGAPQNMLIGGAALWIMQGYSSKVYHGVAEFLAFLARPVIQIEWQDATGYLPVTKSAYRELRARGYYKKHPGALVAIRELVRKKPTANSKGIRLGYYSEIRMLNAQALEAVWSGHVSARKALTRAQKAGDRILQRFREDVVSSPNQRE